MSVQDRAPCPGARRAGPWSRTPATDLVGEPLTRRGQTHPLGQVQLLVHASVHAMLLLAGCCLPSCLLRCAKEWRKVGNSCSNLPRVGIVAVLLPTWVSMQEQWGTRSG